MDDPQIIVGAPPHAGYFVPSRSVEGAFRYVRGNTCTCPAGANKRPCWHIRAVTDLVNANRERRPASPINPAAFVD